MATDNRFDWQQALSKTYEDIALQAVEHIPNILGALLLLILGWLIATLARMVTRKLMGALDVLVDRFALFKPNAQSVSRNYAKISGDIIFWCVLIFFIAASGNMLNWQLFTSLTENLIVYLPNVISGVLIILAGFAIGSITRAAVAKTTLSAGMEHTDLLAGLSQLIVVLTAIVIGVEQLGINVAFISTSLIVGAGVLLSGISLAFGLGAKQLVSNLVAVQSARKLFKVGQRIRIGGVEGYLLEFTSTALIMDTAQGRASIPGQLTHQAVVEILDDDMPSDMPASKESGDTQNESK